MDANIKFRVECLPWDEAWTLFQEKVGNETLNSHPDVPELAKVVAKECGGLPLALITIGRAMSTKKTVQEWNHAITTLRRSASEFPGMGDEVLPLLKLSYDSLGNETIKSCFLYCGLFPEDESIDKTKLIDYWIGEGLISLNEFDHIDEARNHGYDVIGILKGACLLESGKYEETLVKMHDTIRDLALWIAHECGSKRDKILIIEMSNLMPERWHNAERIYLRRFHCDVMEVSSLESPNLLSLIFESSFRILHVPQNCFQFMPLLRVLDLTCSKMKTFPISITGLLELQYLSLSWTYIDVLPEELRNLVKLKYLDLSHMMHLKKIPSGVIGILLELRILNLYECNGDWDLEEVYKLKHLNDLRITINTHHNLKIFLMSNQILQMCTKLLHLSLCNLETPSLHSLPELMNMNMGVWESHYCMAQQHLRSFQNLSRVEICGFKGLKDLTWVGYVGNLKKLHVKGCEELVIVYDDFGGTTGGNEISTMMNNVEDAFKTLETLTMSRLPKLKSICRNALAFPCLQSLVVLECPQLKKLPFDSSRSNVNNTLQEIKGERKWWNELQWEDHDHVKSKFLPYFVEV